MPSDEFVPAIIPPEPPQIENLPVERIHVEPPPPPETQPHELQDLPRHGIAPIWHTLLLVAGILTFSLWGGLRSDAGSEPISAMKGSRVLHYAVSGVFELALVGWVAIGLRLRKIRFRSLLGALPRGLNNITMEIGISAIFWLASMFVLASVGITWTIAQDHIYKTELAAHNQQHQQHEAQKSQGTTPPPESPKPESPQQQQIKMARKLMSFAPENGIEIAAWGALCLIVGFSEELVFRGYMQVQGIQLLRSVVAGVIFSALIFGAAHGYEGLRGMTTICIYGALFSGITLVRRNLLPGMVAHAWHDFATGLALALVRATHLLDKLPSAS
jgi:membrane protease YdiL (CAAX protease family)